ncbi:MAG TPA: hypothetical protein VKB60_02690 [Terriglobales bacterium]|nr:hypothetical protein [Terriglobales bacterium]
MARYKLPIVHQRWILAELFRNLRMVLKELVHFIQFAPRHVTISIPFSRLIFTPIETLFLPHDRVWILVQIFPHFRMLLQVLLQGGMVFHELFIVHQ